MIRTVFVVSRIPRQCHSGVLDEETSHSATIAPTPCSLGDENVGKNHLGHCHVEAPLRPELGCLFNLTEGVCVT